MSKVQQFFIKSNGSDTAIALLEDGVVRELRSENSATAGLLGNIYRGKVRRVLPDMQAAFVDIGLERPGFLHRRNLLDNVENIADSLHEGQSIIVQITQEPTGEGQHQKGATLSAAVSLPGKLLVWLPLSSERGVVYSNKLKERLDSSELEQTKNHLEQEEFGGTLIVRSAYNSEVNQLEDELAWLQRRWQQALDNKHRAPTLLLEELSLTEQVLRDHPEINIMWADEGSREHLAGSANLELFEVGSRSQVVSQAMSQQYESLIRAAEDQRQARIITLSNGGEIVFDSTEALWVVDVNTAAATASDDAHHTTNLLAADEIARQLRLRDIGGIIIVDFIDVNQTHRIELLARLKEQLRQDPVRTSCAANSGLGLIEISRQRKYQSRKPDIERCSVCGGSGILAQRAH